MKKHNSIVKDVNEKCESCNRCHKVFSSESIIVAAYGMLFCSEECAFEEFPDADLNDVELILASDIGVR